VKRIFVLRMSIGKSEVNSGTQLNFSTSKNILKKAVSGIKVSYSKLNLLFWWGLILFQEDELSCSFSQFSYSKRDISKVGVSSRLLGFIKFKPDFSVYIFIAQFWCKDRMLFPRKCSIKLSHNFRFIKWFIDLVWNIFMNQKEVHSIIVVEVCFNLEA